MWRRKGLPPTSRLHPTSYILHPTCRAARVDPVQVEHPRGAGAPHPLALRLRAQDVLDHPLVAQLDGELAPWEHAARTSAQARSPRRRRGRGRECRAAHLQR